MEFSQGKEHEGEKDILLEPREITFDLEEKDEWRKKPKKLYEILADDT